MLPRQLLPTHRFPRSRFIPMSLKRSYSAVLGTPSPSESDIPAFQSHWITHFNTCEDTFELQRGLNNCFGYDMVPPPLVLEAALKASRRLNDFATACRVFGGLKLKTADDTQFNEYVTWLRPLMNELGICTLEELGRTYEDSMY
jgi:cytochrome c oxidase subunit 5a